MTFKSNKKQKLQADLPPFFVPTFKLEFVQYFLLKTITKKKLLQSKKIDCNNISDLRYLQ